VLEDRECHLVGAVESFGNASIGSDAGLLSGSGAAGVAITADCSEALGAADALLDFSVPGVSADLADLAAERCVVHVIGTTGFTRAQESRIEAASKKTAIIKSGNMSVGANVLAALVARAAKALHDFDIQIVEMHHRMKKDAPSGTALMLGRAAARGRGSPAAESAGGVGDDGNIGFASLRGGTVIGEHKVIFAGAHERLILEHVAEDRAIFARGAIAAAKWSRDRKPGLYTMLDVLGLR
jgi:4-hydroxy-tetrahydrodipicolinate reductase